MQSRSYTDSTPISLRGKPYKEPGDDKSTMGERLGTATWKKQQYKWEKQNKFFWPKFKTPDASNDIFHFENTKDIKC